MCMFHMILTRYRGILDLFAKEAIIFYRQDPGIFDEIRLFSIVSMISIIFDSFDRFDSIDTHQKYRYS